MMIARVPSPIHLSLSISLAQACALTYAHFRRPGRLNLPTGQELLLSIRVPTSQRRRDWFGLVIDAGDRLVVAFRGSKTLTDFRTNLLVSQSPYPYLVAGDVHTGYLSLYRSIRDPLLQTLSRQRPRRPLFITGHSMGGALATLAALDAAANTGFRSPVMYNFGSPRVGSPAFAQVYDRLVPQSCRFVIAGDAVPGQPPAQLPLPTARPTRYQHVAQARALPRRPPAQNSHLITSYLSALQELAAATAAGPVT